MGTRSSFGMRGHLATLAVITGSAAYVQLMLGGCPSQLPTDNNTPDTNTPDNNTPPTTYSGEALLAQSVLFGSETRVVDTGDTPAAGGEFETSLLDIDNGVLTADVAHSTVIAGNGVSRAEASMADVTLNVGGHVITADFVMARAVASCSGLTPSVSGLVSIDNLMIDGKAQTVTLDPNQGIVVNDLSGHEIGRVAVNEQTTTTNGTDASITVDGLHVLLTDVAEVVLFQAHADISCGQSVALGDFITGGGVIRATPSGGRAVFGFEGGSQNGTLSVQLNYIDKDAALKLHATSISSYTATNSTTRQIQGACQVNGTGGFTFTLVVADNGEPGGNDTFDLTVSNGYHAGGTLASGNIQLHHIE